MTQTNSPALAAFQSPTTCALFRGISEDHAWSLVAQHRIVSVDPGTVLISPDSVNDRLYIARTGSFAVHLESLDNPVHRVLGPGQLFGEISLLRHCRPTAYVVATEQSMVLVLGEKELAELLMKDDRICRNLIGTLADTIVHNTRHVIDEQQRIAELEARTRRDALTGLFNRAWFDDELRRLTRLQSEKAFSFALLLLDVDLFHDYNSRHGHQGGDVALVALSRALQSHVRPLDGVARYGGEEFAILLPGANHEAATGVAERVLAAVRKLVVRTATGEILSSLTVSAGLAVSWPEAEPAEIIRLADARLYAAKKAGRDRLAARD